MAITELLFDRDVSPRPAQVLPCMLAWEDDGEEVFRDDCGVRCSLWGSAIGFSERPDEHQAAVYTQLAAELCEATPEVLRGAVSAALRESSEQRPSTLREMAKRAQVMLTMEEPDQQKAAVSLLTTFAGDLDEFERTVQALAA